MIHKLYETGSLTAEELLDLIINRTPERRELLRELAEKRRQEVYGRDVFIRGLIEFSNICRQNCYYCGIRCGNTKVQRYRLTVDEILSCCHSGYKLGFRTFVLQGGEDPHFTDDIFVEIITKIKAFYPDCAVSLSLGERSYESFKRLREAGADRYLMRHETADAEHYSMLHPENLSLASRMEALKNLKSLGYQTGCGFMVGSPFQKPEHIVKDLLFIKEFQPEMVGIGPFMPQKDTPFGDKPAGSVELTLYLLSITRLLLPNVLLPATTALGSAQQGGRESGVLAGANVVMPNLSPTDVRDKYTLYDNKLSIGAESIEGLNALRKSMRDIGYEVVTDRGDAARE
ncbi:MAG: [FeFe] hydrogenase H-cluster radical SAM maturase HydE [Ruminococcaceae bacterium]|nr:[FeFe] hydrogenase H-cluster radical SAM maturase HydE [Oscillospiraceae bacterium]